MYVFLNKGYVCENYCFYVFAFYGAMNGGFHLLTNLVF